MNITYKKHNIDIIYHIIILILLIIFSNQEIYGSCQGNNKIFDKDSTIHNFVKDNIITDGINNEQCESSLKFQIKTLNEDKKMITLNKNTRKTLYVVEKNRGEFVLSEEPNDQTFKNLLPIININTDVISGTTNRINNQLCSYFISANQINIITCQKQDNIRQKQDNIKTTNQKPKDICPKNLNNSMWEHAFSGKLIGCIKDSLDNMLFSSKTSYGIANIGRFQDKMQKAVLGIILLYIIFFSINIMLEYNNVNKKLFIMFFLKILLVIYFSIGFNISDELNQEDKRNENGFVKDVLPLLISFPNQLSSLLYSAINQGKMCNFSNQQYEDPFYKIWDSIDCRILTYLGFINPLIENQSKTSFDEVGIKTQSGLRWFVLFFPTFVLGLQLLVMMIFAISSMIIFISAIYTLAYTSVIFIPMALFNQTKGYFSKWLNLIISFSIQPVIILIFTLTIFFIYENILYKECVWGIEKNNNNKISKFYLNEQQNQKCKGSFGYIFAKSLAGEPSDYNQGETVWQVALTLIFFIVIAQISLYKMSKIASTLSGSVDIGKIAISELPYIENKKKNK